MNTLTFDKYKFIKQLQSKGISEEQAEVIVDVIKETSIEITEKLVTKPELHQYKSDMKMDFQSLENRLVHHVKDEIAKMQKENAPMRTQMAVMMWSQGLIVLTLVVPAIKQMLGL